MFIVCFSVFINIRLSYFGIPNLIIWLSNFLYTFYIASLLMYVDLNLKGLSKNNCLIRKNCVKIKNKTILIDLYSNYLYNFTE